MTEYKLILQAGFQQGHGGCCHALEKALKKINIIALNFASVLNLLHNIHIIPSM